MFLAGRAVLLAAVAACAVATAQDDGERLVIYEFASTTDAQQWRTVNDTVMGGVSTSTFRTPGNGIGVFSGYVSLENYGGFASVRSRPSFRDLSEWKGISLRVRGDGKSYKLGLKNNMSWNAVMYQASFQTTAGQWTEVRLPFTSCCTPQFRGRDVPEAPALDPSRILQISLMISEKQEGPFQIELDWISAYR
jgi:monofunctional biosynthetic peptidoglycan transglycosylase